MGFIKNIANQPKEQTFPSSQFVIAGDVPVAQCSKAHLEGDSAVTFAAPFRQLEESGKFVGHDLTGDVCTITASVGGNTGDFDIASNSNNALTFVQDPGAGNPVAYYVHNGGELIETRNVQSFAEFIDAAGYAYTIKGGQLYTNMPSAELAVACQILFAPLT